MKSVIATVANKLLWLPKEIYYVVRYILPPIFSAHMMAGKIEPAKRSLQRIPKSAVSAVVPFYGTHALLPHFLSYYRRLGVSHFVFLDLSRARALAKTLADEPDCTVWQRKGNASVSNAIHWLNFLRWRYGLGRWCLSVEPSDFLVFPHSETRTLRDLTEFLASEGRRHIYALVIEAYGEAPAESIQPAPSASPQDLLPYFDPIGYSHVTPGRLRSAVTAGGIQRRVLYRQTPALSPALNRTPLVKLRWFNNYLASTRLMVPGLLNTAHSRWHLNPTACLMRYALLEDRTALAIAANAERTTLIADDAQPTYPGLTLLRDMPLKHASSARFVDSQDLMAWGLMNTGQWF